jgi:hypothetical protein
VAVGALPVSAAEVNVAKADSNNVIVDFSGYVGGSAAKWLETRGFKLEQDAKKPNLLALSIDDNVLTLEAKGRMTGFILNDSVNLDDISKVKIKWGIRKYPQDVSYQNKVNNEALMLYFFFGKEKVSSGHNPDTEQPVLYRPISMSR